MKTRLTITPGQEIHIDAAATIRALDGQTVNQNGVRTVSMDISIEDVGARVVSPNLGPHDLRVTVAEEHP